MSKGVSREGDPLSSRFFRISHARIKELVLRIILDIADIFCRMCENTHHSLIFHRERILENMMRIGLHWMSHCWMEHLRGVHVWLGKHAWHQVLSTLHQGSLMAINMGVWVWDLILVVDGSMIWVKLWSVDNRLLLLCLLLL